MELQNAANCDQVFDYVGGLIDNAPFSQILSFTNPMRRSRKFSLLANVVKLSEGVTTSRTPMLLWVRGGGGGGK